MRVPAEAAALEAQAKIIREAGEALVEADAFERWGSKGNVAEAEAIFKAAGEASSRKEVAVKALEKLVTELRRRKPEAVAAWADAHVELLDEYLGRVPADSTEAYVAHEERGKWARVRAGELGHFRQNTYYVRYARDRYEAIFGFPY